MMSAHDAQLANQIHLLEPWPMTRLSCYLAWQKLLCSVTERLQFSMHTARGPKTQRACIECASVIIQSLSHNQLLGWQGQRCAARLENAGIEPCANKSNTECSLGKRHGCKPKLLAKTVNRRNSFLS